MIVPTLWRDSDRVKQSTKMSGVLLAALLTTLGAGRVSAQSVSGRDAPAGESESCTFQSPTTCWNVWGPRAAPLGTLPARSTPNLPGRLAVWQDSLPPSIFSEYEGSRDDGR
jgi:hypothetical protein